MRLIVRVVARGVGRTAPYVAFRRLAVWAGGRRGGRRLGVSVADERITDNPHVEHLGAEMAARSARRRKV